MKMSNSIFFLLPILMGAFLPLMALSNANLGKSFGSPFTATFGIFLVALIGITMVILISKVPMPTLHQITGTRLWFWIGGLIVVMNIVTFTISPSKIGIGNMIIFFVAAQLISTIIIEHFGLFNTIRHTINWQRVLGVSLLIGGVFLIKKF
jgi:transporter family-2 protein